MRGSPTGTGRFQTTGKLAVAPPVSMATPAAATVTAVAGLGRPVAVLLPSLGVERKVRPWRRRPLTTVLVGHLTSQAVAIGQQSPVAVPGTDAGPVPVNDPVRVPVLSSKTSQAAVNV